MVLNLLYVPGYAVANSLKYAQNPRKILVKKNDLTDVVSLTDCHFIHCRLAKFRGLMRRVKYGAVIG